MSRFYNNLYIFLSAALLSLTGCSSTDIVEPSPAGHNNYLTLTVSAPDAYGFGATTRADDQHKLRLVARLFSTDAPSTPIMTKEELPNSAETTLQFQIENHGNYFVTIFADYIDNNATISEGHYPDKYYNTTAPDKITTITGKGDFFNNDNRDCFVGKVSFEKGSSEVSRSLTLRRPVCKVQVAAPGNNVDGLISSLRITSCSHFDSYSFTLDSTEKPGSLTSTATSPVDLTLPNENATNNSPADDNLLFFYTFGGDAGDDSRPALGEIKFELTPLTGVELNNTERSISAGLIKPAPNYLVTVKGGDGWISSKPGGDDITVIFEGLNDWNDTPNTVN